MIGNIGSLFAQIASPRAEFPPVNLLHIEFQKEAVVTEAAYHDLLSADLESVKRFEELKRALTIIRSKSILPLAPSPPLPQQLLPPRATKPIFVV